MLAVQIAESGVVFGHIERAGNNLETSVRVVNSGIVGISVLCHAVAAKRPSRVCRCEVLGIRGIANIGERRTPESIDILWNA